MEGDIIRASSGGDMLIDLWVEGAMRELVITREAIAAAAGSDLAAALDDDQRREFVRTRLPLVQAAARTALAEGGPRQTRITLKAACLIDPALTKGGERRGADRRLGERRVRQAPAAALPHGERRRRERRRSDRRGALATDTPA